jgi:Tetracyclin repressor-like, C-terminal domain
VRSCVELLEQFKRAKELEFSSRTAALSLFGMMNWIYTWYRPRADGNAEELAQQMGDIFLRGVCSEPGRGSKKS